MLTENHVMSDVNEVIYFAAFTNYGGIECRSVDGAISPYLYIIVNDYVTDLGDFEMTPLMRNIKFRNSRNRNVPDESSST